MQDMRQRKSSETQGTPPYGTDSSQAFTDAPSDRRRPESSQRPDLNEKLVCESERMQELQSVLERLSVSKAPVLISGAPGSGKRLVAQTLFQHSPTAHAGPLSFLSCDGLTAQRLDEEAQRAGRGGLVLASVETLDDDAQRMLLGVLDRLHPRIFATTSARLKEVAKNGGFRPELLYRIQVLSVRVPPLAERPEDIPRLWDVACEQAANALQKRVPKTAPEVLAHLQRYRWPNNVVELKAVARAAVHAATRQNANSEGITMEALPEQMMTPQATTDEIRLPGMRLRDLERIAILKTYAATGSAKATAEMLDISVRKVHYRLKEYRTESN